MTDVSKISVIDHPLVQHKLTLMRDRDTPTAQFRHLLREISLLLAYEVTRDLPLGSPIETPLEPDAGAAARRQEARASSRSCAPATASSTACWTWCPRRASATSGCIAIRRRCSAVEYYFKLPEDMPERLCIVVDPMLATGNSAIAAVTRLKEARRDAGSASSA